MSRGRVRAELKVQKSWNVLELLKLLLDRLA
jgi:hypothetical protein